VSWWRTSATSGDGLAAAPSAHEHVVEALARDASERKATRLTRPEQRVVRCRVGDGLVRRLRLDGEDAHRGQERKGVAHPGLAEPPEELERARVPPVGVVGDEEERSLLGAVRQLDEDVALHVGEQRSTPPPAPAVGLREHLDRPGDEPGGSDKRLARARHTGHRRGERLPPALEAGERVAERVERDVAAQRVAHDHDGASAAQLPQLADPVRQARLPHTRRSLYQSDLTLGLECPGDVVRDAVVAQHGPQVRHR
jgi:hypothetical protein